MPPRPPADRTVELASRLNSSAIRLLRRIGRDDAKDGLTRARASAMSVLAFGGPQTLGRLAAIEQVAPPTMSRTVEGLVRDALVERHPVAGDRRATLIVPTAAGRTAIDRARSRRVRALAAELGGLPKRDIAALEAGLAVLGRLEERARNRSKEEAS